MTLQDLIRLVIRWWRIVVVLVVAGTGLGYFVEGSRPATYESDGRLVIGPSLEQPGSIIESTGALSRGTLGQTLAQVITGSEVRRAAEADTGGSFGQSFDIDSVVIPESNVVEVSVTGPGPEDAAALAQAVMEQTEQAFEDLYPIYDVVLLDVPEASTTPISPDPALGAVVGAAAGSAIALLVAVALGTRPLRRRRPAGTASDQGHDGDTHDIHLDGAPPRVHEEHTATAVETSAPAPPPAPDVIEADVIEPDVIEPDVIEPDVIEPDVIEADVIQPDVIEPDVIQPDVIEPDVIEPDAADDTVEDAVSSSRASEPAAPSQVRANPTTPTMPARAPGEDRDRPNGNSWVLPGVGTGMQLIEDPFEDVTRVDVTPETPAWLRDIAEGGADSTRHR